MFGTHHYHVGRQGVGSNGFAVGATFEGEFSNVTRSYAGKGVVRHVL